MPELRCRAGVAASGATGGGGDAADRRGHRPRPGGRLLAGHPGAQTFTKAQGGGTVAAGDVFGFGLAAGDFNNDGDSDLGVGAPFEAVGAAVAAGAVSAVAGSTGGLLGGGLLFSQATAGVPSVAEPGDFFGWALAAGDPGPATTTAGSPSAAASSASRVQRAAAGR